MISFVWTDKDPMYSGRGGTENFTAGHVRELTSMGIESRVISVGLEKHPNSEYFSDIEFKDLASIDELSELDDTIVFVNTPHPVETKLPSFCIFHCPPRTPLYLRAEYKESMKDKSAIVASKYMQDIWANYLGLEKEAISIVYPFADPNFANVKRPTPTSDIVNVLFAGRLHIEKGVFLYLEAIQHEILEYGYSFSITNAGNQTSDGKALEELLKHHSSIELLEARRNPTEMAKLLARYRIVVMPSNTFFWHEGFGMLSVEAQHAGCQVIGSNGGGLPETDCGGLTLFEPGNSLSLAEAIHKVAQSNPVTTQEKYERCQYFTRRQSAERLIEVIASV